MNMSTNLVSNALMQLQLLSSAQSPSEGAGKSSGSEASAGLQSASGSDGCAGQQRAVDFGGQSGSSSASPAASGLSTVDQGNGSGTGTSSSDSIQALIKELMVDLLQQMIKMLNPSKSSDGGDDSTGGVGSSGSGSGFSAPATTERMAVPQDAAAQPAASSGAGTDTGAGTGAGSGDANASTPAAAASSTPASAATSATTADSGATGTSGLHLPDALKPFEADIQNAADKTGMPANVIAGQIWAESRGNLSAATVNGGNGQADSGLMQVNATTAQDMKSKNPGLFDSSDINSPKNNIMAGALYLKEQSDSFGGNMGAALRAYNSGPNNVNTNDLSDISKTGTGAAPYVDNVMSYAKIIGTGQGQLPA